MNLLRSHGISTYILPRFVDESHELSFAEMALLKITPWSFVDYEKVQFFDGDVMPTQNMDCFFQLDLTTFTVGAASPLNSGWYLAKPHIEIFKYLREKAIWRLGRDWDKENGWGDPLPKEENALFYRGGTKPVVLWDFNGADMDQGLCTQYFVLNFGGAFLIDTVTRVVRKFETGLLKGQDIKLVAKDVLSCCEGKEPTRFFAHFTGRNKPWMTDLTALEDTRKNEQFITWKNKLDSLNLAVNSSNIGELGLGSPLGFFNRDFPKGGLKTKVIQHHERSDPNHDHHHNKQQGHTNKGAKNQNKDKKKDEKLHDNKHKNKKKND